MQKALKVEKTQQDLNSIDMNPAMRKSIGKSLSPLQLSLRRPHRTIKDSVPKAVRAVTIFQKSRIMPYIPPIPKLNAAVDAKDSIYTLHSEYKHEKFHNINEESIYYRFPKPNNNRTKKSEGSNFFGSFVEEIISDVQPFSLPQKTIPTTEMFPELNFMQDLKQSLFVSFI